VVELPVLRPQERLVIAAQPVEHLARGTRALRQVERRHVRQTESFPDRRRNERRVVNRGERYERHSGDALGSHQPADVVRPGAAQGLHGHPHVVVGDERVPVETHHDLVPGGRQRQVERGSTRRPVLAHVHAR
jgi:hypothetical protein